ADSGTGYVGLNLFRADCPVLSQRDTGQERYCRYLTALPVGPVEHLANVYPKVMARAAQRNTERCLRRATLVTDEEQEITFSPRLLLLLCFLLDSHWFTVPFNSCQPIHSRAKRSSSRRSLLRFSVPICLP